MGFFSSIGNFISNNVQSVVHDVTHVVSQVTNNPIVSNVLPIVGMAFDIPPQVTSAALGLVNNAEAQILHTNDNNVADTPVSSTPTQDPKTPTAKTPDGQLLYTGADGKYYYVSNDQPFVQQSAQTTTANTNTSNAPIKVTPVTATQKTFVQKVTDSMKSYWYLYAGGAIALGTGVYYFFFKKPTKRRL